MATLRDVFDDRLEEFRKEYPFNEQDEVIRALTVTGEMLDMVFNRDEAALGMTALRKIIAYGTNPTWKWAELDKVDLDKDWRTTWENLDGWNASSTPPFLDELHDLNAFGNFGIFPSWDLAAREKINTPEGHHLKVRLEALHDASSWVASVCDKIDLFERLTPRNADGKASLDVLLSTRDRARARMQYDLGHPISIHDLALLSDVSVKRVQNAIYAKTDEAPIVDKNGLISPESCEPWLTARDYIPSIWKQVSDIYPLQPNWGNDIQFGEVMRQKSIEDFVFVPVANDGTIFTPTLRCGKEEKYQVGPKGDESRFENFEEALTALQKMASPYWRRPNRKNGKPGIVTGQAWKRVRKSELEKL